MATIALLCRTVALRSYLQKNNERGRLHFEHVGYIWILPVVTSTACESSVIGGGQPWPLGDILTVETKPVNSSVFLGPFRKRLKLRVKISIISFLMFSCGLFY